MVLTWQVGRSLDSGDPVTAARFAGAVDGSRSRLGIHSADWRDYLERRGHPPGLFDEIDTSHARRLGREFDLDEAVDTVLVLAEERTLAVMAA